MIRNLIGFAFFLAKVIVALALVGAFAAGALVALLSKSHAADDATCHTYSVSVEKLVMTLTNDMDISQAARDRSFTYCGVVDIPPVIRIESQGTAPATDDTWAKACRKRYGSFRASDGTVLPYHKRTRVPCPLSK